MHSSNWSPSCCSIQLETWSYSMSGVTQAAYTYRTVKEQGVLCTIEAHDPGCWGAQQEIPSAPLGLSVIVGTWKPLGSQGQHGHHYEYLLLRSTTHLPLLTLSSHPKATALWLNFHVFSSSWHISALYNSWDGSAWIYVCPSAPRAEQSTGLSPGSLPSGAQKFTDTTMANNELLNIWAKISWNHPICVLNTINDSWSQQNKHDTISYD